MTAIKHDQDKARFELLPTAALTEISLVLTYGARKYSPENWRSGEGFKWGRLSGAALRHLFAFIGGEDKDPETGLSHLAHAACCVLFLLEHKLKGLGQDDRFKYPEREFANPPLIEDSSYLTAPAVEVKTPNEPTRLTNPADREMFNGMQDIARMATGVYRL